MLFQIYPQYYDIIKDPIDLRMIAQKIQNSQYSSIDELEKDFVLLTKNARSFNEPKSPIYQVRTCYLDYQNIVVKC